jgi:predicted CDP-diglyceride synthetase/phosphatidate cytidylyltransferase
LFGSAKTVRGFISAVIVTSIAGSIMGYSFITGALFALASLCGDLASSFIKRRLGLLPGSRALGLDQLPESIFPLIVCWQVMGINMLTAAIVVIMFFIGELVVSKFLFRLHIRDHPY